MGFQQNPSSLLREEEALADAWEKIEGGKGKGNEYDSPREKSEI